MKIGSKDKFYIKYDNLRIGVSISIFTINYISFLI